MYNKDMDDSFYFWCPSIQHWPFQHNIYLHNRGNVFGYYHSSQTFTISIDMLLYTYVRNVTFLILLVGLSVRRIT